MTALLTGIQVGQIRRLTSVGAVLVALVMSGCGGSYWYHYKPGVSEQQMRQDGFECKQISRQQYIVGTGGMLLGGSEPNFAVWKECLEARGYIVQSEEERAQAPSSRPAATTTPTDAFADIRDADSMQRHLNSWQQSLDRAVETGKLTKEEADGLYQEREKFLSKRINTTLVQREYQYLMAEKSRLDQQKASLDREPDSVQHQQAVLKYNQQVAAYQARVKAYDELRLK